MDELFNEVGQNEQSNLIAVLNNYLDEENITADEFKLNEHMYIREFRETWSAYLLVRDTE
jgi:hypothetical protein